MRTRLLSPEMIETMVSELKENPNISVLDLCAKMSDKFKVKLSESLYQTIWRFKNGKGYKHEIKHKSHTTPPQIVDKILELRNKGCTLQLIQTTIKNEYDFNMCLATIRRRTIKIDPDSE